MAVRATKPAPAAAWKNDATRSEPSDSSGAGALRDRQCAPAPAARPRAISGSETAAAPVRSPSCVRPCTSDASATPVSAKPARSNGRRSPPACAGMKRSTSATPARPSGMLRKKIQRHEATSTSAPPSTGPTTGAMSMGQVIIPSASISRDLGVSCSTTMRPTGDMNAAAAPCAMRAATNQGSDGASPQASDASVKAATAEANTSRAPKRSAAQPAAGTNTTTASR